MSIDLISSG